MADLAARLVPIAGGLLGPGEELVGCCVATWRRTFSGSMVVIVTTPARIIVQPLDRRFTPSADPVSLPRERIARVAVRNGVGGSVTIPSIIMDAVSVTVDLTSVEGARWKLLLMGSGGPVQHDGIAALLAFLEFPEFPVFPAP